MLGALDVKEIGYADLERFIDNLPNTLGKKTQRNILNALHAAFKWLWRKGVIQTMPPFPVIKGNDSKERAALTYEEPVEGFSKIPDEHQDIYTVSFETSIRPGELCALKVSDISNISEISDHSEANLLRRGERNDQGKTQTSRLSL